jgi:DNA-binding MarR family transcriptional regulator/GNAT superfamily N-acetyltransferase
MQEARVAGVRRFNRLVTQRVGALSDRYLARDRPLGEARVLWEIGLGGCEVRTLRRRLELDSGYLSRLLRSLEAEGLARVGPSRHDRRVGRAELTRKGRAEWAVLDRRSDELARRLLSRLDESAQERLTAAMREVERLLTAALIEIEPMDPAEPLARWCLDQYVAELDRRFPGGFDPGKSISAGEDELRPPAGAFLVATLRGEPVGCGALKLHDGAPAELKRMWVAESARGLGLGRRLLTELEQLAVAGGAHAVHLETNRTLREAIALYRSAGYREVDAFNDERYADHWFAKSLGALATGTSTPARRRTRTKASRSPRG